MGEGDKLGEGSQLRHSKSQPVENEHRLEQLRIKGRMCLVRKLAPKTASAAFWSRERPGCVALGPSVTPQRPRSLVARSSACPHMPAVHTLSHAHRHREIRGNPISIPPGRAQHFGRRRYYHQTIPALTPKQAQGEMRRTAPRQLLTLHRQRCQHQHRAQHRHSVQPYLSIAGHDTTDSPPQANTNPSFR